MNNFVEIYLKNRNKIFIAYNETSIYIILLDLCKFYFHNSNLFLSLFIKFINLFLFV